MKDLLKVVAIFLFVLMVVSCSKTSFINSPDASVNFSSDTLRFDTVFTTTGSVTQSFKIFNLNDQSLRLSNVKLMGGTGSAFKVNLDGSPGVNFSNIELQPHDSIYLFVSVSINPNAGNLPFIVQDSIQVNYNGNSRFIQLQAFGQNANFLRNRHITKDSTWKNDLPFVILDAVTVDSGVALTIEKGCKVYAHADAPIIVNGSLKANGEVGENSRVVFQGDRLDPDYRDFPAAWPGIFFSSSSDNNVLNYAVIKNAYQGIITESAVSLAKITLNQCIIDNIYDAGIISVASSIRASNCLITNCGSNIVLGGGGIYAFNHCTVATYGSLFITHKTPVLFVSNAFQSFVGSLLDARFTNCIFYGDGGIAENEILVEKKGSPPPADYSVVFQSVLYRNKADQPNATFNNSIKNAPPQFDSIDVGRRYYDFHLKSTSPAVNAGSPTGLNFDLDGKVRDAKPDLGSFEH